MKRAPIKALPSKEELGNLFVYDPETGELRWRVQLPKAWHARPGTRAGTITKRSGYYHVGIRRQYYYVHRIIWKMMTGEEPLEQIDHIDGNRLNNCWTNLRAADNQKNLWNAKLLKSNTSGFKGVGCRPENTKRPWVAKLYVGQRKSLYLGCFATKEAAAEAWWHAAQRQRNEFARAS